MQIVAVFFVAVLVNNFVLYYFVGICPFIGVSKKVDAATSMGMAVTFVMTITAAVTWLINNLVLIPFGLPFLEYVSYIVVIASLVQFLEMFIKKTFPELYKTLGIFLPLITTNCAILFVALIQAMRAYGFITSIAFGFGAGVGFTLAIVIMAGIREQLEVADIPRPFRGAAITLIVAGVLALAFMGFTGLVSA
ncbi:MAG: electron transport complex subunit RsxA [Spirochaetaceae bacterium]|nr:electron transport complex subunit RsxA [Spirochaetaceae bacterium]MCF7947410.1 electron transport complex subunit RsxA [Spirochaetia bacterium]MCF7951325.1 electron transport complex subunit RsxA [Spirochaetaceae bacterium]